MKARSSFMLFLLTLTILCCSDKPPKIKEGFFIINDSDVYYKIMGSGEPLLVIHGGPVLDHSYFLPHLEELAKDYQLIFYDQRSCGRSSIEIDSATMNLAGFVEDIEQIRQKMGFEKWNVLGHSWGGLIAMEYAVAHNDRIDHLILANSMAPSSTDWQKDNLESAKRIDAQDQNRLDKIVSTGLLRSANAAPYIKEMMMLSFKSQMFDKANIDKLDLYIPNNFQKRSAVFSLLGPDLAAYNLYGDLKKITVPTLVMYGAAESAVNLHARKMVDSLGNGQLKVIPLSGHFPFIENPTAFDRSVKSFLNR